MIWAVLGFVGCVPKGKHEITVVQLQATQTALSARSLQSTTAALQADGDMANLRQEIAERQRQLDALDATLTTEGVQLESLQAQVLALTDEVDRLEAALVLANEALVKARKPVVTVPPATASEAARSDLRAALAVAAETERAAARHQAAREEAANAFASLVADGKAEAFERGMAYVVRLQTALLYQEGHTNLSPRGQALVEQVAAAFEAIPGRVVSIEGHTDARPLHTAEFPSNWERGFSRAVVVLRALEGASAPATFSASSYAGRFPLADNLTAEGRDRNNRVELVIEVDPDQLTAFSPTPPEPPDEGEDGSDAPEPTPAPDGPTPD